MEKQDILKEIKKTVDSNSKKGKLTTTKFVGTYNYKSGYDTYIAVSYDSDKNLIVYSYYQNDRGEHIDTYTTTIDKISEKELNEVFENLNTSDEEILEYIEWCHLEDKNQEVLIKLGLYKPKKKKEVVYDINSIPELENKNDGYYVERNGHIGIMKFVAKESEKLYDKHARYFYRKDVGGDIKYFYHITEPKMFDYSPRQIKNDNLFKILSDYDDYTDYKCAFVPTKKMLIDAINDSENLGTLYMVGYKGEKLLDCLAWERGSHDAEEGYKGFTDEKDAVKYYNTLLDATKEEVKELLKEYESTLKALESVFKGSKGEFFTDHYIDPKNASPGKYIFMREEFISEAHKRKLIGIEIELVKKDDEFIYLSDGTVISRDSNLMTKEDFNTYKELYNDEVNETIYWGIYRVKENIEWMNKFLSREYAASFTKEFVYSVRGFNLSGLKNDVKKYAERVNLVKVSA